MGTDARESSVATIDCLANDTHCQDLPTSAAAIRDFFHRATETKMRELRLLVSNLFSSLTFDRLSEVGVDLPDLLREYCEGSNKFAVKILVWRPLTNDGHLPIAAPYIQTFLTYNQAIRVRTSATAEHSNSLNRFMVASNFDDRWIVRMEEKHELHDPEIYPSFFCYSEGAPDASAALIGAKLAGTFNSLWESAFQATLH